MALYPPPRRTFGPSKMASEPPVAILLVLALLASCMVAETLAAVAPGSSWAYRSSEPSTPVWRRDFSSHGESKTVYTTPIPKMSRNRRSTLGIVSLEDTERETRLVMYARQIMPF